MTVRISKPEFNLREKLSELDKPTGLKGSELMRSENTQDVRDIVHADRKNIIINGAMEVCQRDTTVTGITANGYYCCDRWHLQLHGPTLRLEQDNDNPGHGFTNSLAVTTTTAVGSIAAGNSIKIRYLIEGYDIARLEYGTKYAKPFTLSFWVKSSLTGQFAISFTRDSRIVNRQVTVHAVNTWEHKSITILGDYDTAFSNTTNGTGMILQMFPSSGSNSTAGANIPVWNSFHNAHTAYGANMGHLTTTGSVFKITGVQMEIGTQHTDFEHVRFGEELLLCQRYFETINLYGANTTYTGGGYNRHIGEVFWKVEKRAIPTSNTPGVGNYQPGGGTGTVTLSGPTIHGAVLNSGNTNSTYPDGWINSGSILKVDAEL